MLFADTRNDDIYNRDFLNSADAEFMNGFDYAVEQIRNLIENNLDVYETELTEVLDEDVKPLEDEIFATREDLFEIVEENKELLATIVMDWAERESDQMVTSMIDGMDEEEYKSIREKKLAEAEEGQYYDTLHYAFKNEKRIREV